MIVGGAQTIQHGLGLKYFTPFCSGRFSYDAAAGAWTTDAAVPQIINGNTTISVDPVGGNDQTANGPFQTIRRLNEWWTGAYITAVLTVQILGDIPNTDDPLNISLIGRFQGNGGINIQGTPQVVHSGTLTSGTIAINAIAPGGGQRQIVSDTATIPTNGFSAFEGGFQLVVTSGANAQNRIWVVNHIPGGPRANASAPVNPNGVRSNISTGDTYVIQRGSFLSMGAATTPPTSSGVIQFFDISFQGTSLSDFAYILNTFFSITFRRCSWAGGFVNPIGAPGGSPNTIEFIDCYVPLGNGEVLPNSSYMVAGVLIINSILLAGNYSFSDDTYVTGGGLVITAGVLIFVFANSGAGIQLQDCTNNGAIVVEETSTTLGTGFRASFGSGGVGQLWGNGNTGYGLVLLIGANLEVSSVFVPTVTGALGDIGAILPNQFPIPVATAQPYSLVGGNYGTAQTLNWANFANPAIFNFSAHKPQSGISLIGGTP